MANRRVIGEKVGAKIVENEWNHLAKLKKLDGQRAFFGAASTNSSGTANSPSNFRKIERMRT